MRHSFRWTKVDYNQFMSKEEYIDRKSFYFLDQGHVLTHFKVTTRDCLLSIRLLFQEDLREHIPYILSALDRQKRLTLDEWTGKQNACYRQLLIRFIDPEYAVTFPPKLFLEHTKQKINEKFDSAPGKTWDNFNKVFDPNDPARTLPRTESFLKHIVSTTILAYNTVMVDYTKNTGWSDGDGAAVMI